MYKQIIISLILITMLLLTVSANDVILYQKFDGNTQDSSGNGYTMYEYYVEYEDEAIKNEGIKFDGIRTYVRVYDDPLLSFTDGTNDENFSVSFWYKPYKEGQWI